MFRKCSILGSPRSAPLNLDEMEVRIVKEVKMVKEVKIVKEAKGCDGS